MKITRQQQKELRQQGKKCCQKCGDIKPLEDFSTKGYLKNGETNYGYCKNCSKQRSRKFMQDNYHKVKIQREGKKEEIAKYKRDRYNNDSDYKFYHIVLTHLRGVENRKQFIDKWANVKKSYEEEGIPTDTDHLVPRSWFKVNTDMELINNIDNLQVIDAHYNRSKQDRWSDPVPSDYLDKIRPYIKKEFKGLLKSL